MNGARQAASLTQQLLAFSRRQPLDPNALVGSMSDLLNRSLGETIAVETVRGAGLWRVEVDPNALKAAILNLAVNARDAMPEGGRLTIETMNTHIDAAYTVAHAEVATDQAARRLLEGASQIDLLFSDVILPGGMTGAQIGARAASGTEGAVHDRLCAQRDRSSWATGQGRAADHQALQPHRTRREGPRRAGWATGFIAAPGSLRPDLRHPRSTPAVASRPARSRPASQRVA